jgi:hypothetical protein
MEEEDKKNDGYKGMVRKGTESICNLSVVYLTALSVTHTVQC